MTDIPVPTLSVREANRRLSDALADVRRLVDSLGHDLAHLEIYAREQSGEVRGQYKSTEASRAYDDMADRIKSLRGIG